MKAHHIGLGFVIAGYIACMTLFAWGLASSSGCSMIERAFDQSIQDVRELPADAPTPGWQGLATNFLYTLLVGATGGAGLYGGVIRPRRIARQREEASKPDIYEKLVETLRERVDERLNQEEKKE